MHNNEVRPLPYTYTKIISKWMKDLNVRPETVKLLENTGEKLHDTGFGNNFLNKTENHRQQKQNIQMGRYQT